MIREIARRHKKPRYVPLAPGRGVPAFDPARIEHTHPSWCSCPRCPAGAAPGPADRRRIGCVWDLATFLFHFAIGLGVVAMTVGLIAAGGGRAALILLHPIFGSL